MEIVNKKYEDFNFKFVKQYDISDIKNIVSTFDKQWDLDDERSKRNIKQKHVYTKSYLLYGLSEMWIPGAQAKFTIKCQDQKLWEFFSIIYKDVEELYNGKLSSALIVKLAPNKEVLPHEDDTDQPNKYISQYYQACRRFHIALKTNDSAILNIDGESKNMKVGECWEINNNKTHYALNESEEERIHLIFDILPTKYME
jgi:hypothetical protein